MLHVIGYDNLFGYQAGSKLVVSHGIRSALQILQSLINKNILLTRWYAFFASTTFRSVVHRICNKILARRCEPATSSSSGHEATLLLAISPDENSTVHP